MPVKITGFIWLEDIVDKLASKHHVEVEEVEEVFANRPKRDMTDGERRLYGRK